MESRLSEKEKELVAVGASVAAGCIPCTRYHVKAVQAAGASPSAAPREAEPEARPATSPVELAVLREEYASLNDKYLRKLADDVNYRKRMERERLDGQRYALVALLGDLIPVLDDFDRAVASAETARDYNVLHDGVLLIRRQLGQMLENKYGLKRIEALGKPFDPNHHEAVAMDLSPLPEGGAGGGAHEDPLVVEEFLPGYWLHERVIRTAKVKVRMPAPGQAAAPAAPQGRDAGSPGAGGAGEGGSEAAGGHGPAVND